MSVSKIERKVLVEVCFVCEDCDLNFHNEVIGLGLLNVNSENGHVTLNGKIATAKRQCPNCAKECGVCVCDLDILNDDMWDCGEECLCNLTDEEIDEILDEECCDGCRLIEEMKKIVEQNKQVMPYQFPPYRIPYNPNPTYPWSPNVPYVGDPPYNPTWSGGTGDQIPDQNGTIMCSTNEN